MCILTCLRGTFIALNDFILKNIRKEISCSNGKQSIQKIGMMVIKIEVKEIKRMKLKKKIRGSKEF